APVAAAEARGLHAAHGGVHAAPGRRVAVVDVDRAGQEALGDGPPAGGVAAVHAGVEPVLGVVGLLDRLVVAVHRVDGHHRAEGLLPVEVHLGGDVGEHGGLVEQGADVGAVTAAGHQPGPLGDRVVDVGPDLLQLGGRGQRADLGAERLLGSQA